VSPELARRIRWPRTKDRHELFLRRRDLCSALADIFNKHLAEGAIDAQLAESTITPLLKAAKPGQPVPDATDPNNYRGINVGNVLPKIMSAVLTCTYGPPDALGGAAASLRPGAGRLHLPPRRRLARLHTPRGAQAHQPRRAAPTTSSDQTHWRS
jgi:hypothetical protein